MRNKKNTTVSNSEEFRLQWCFHLVTRRRFELRTPCLKGTRQGASPLDVPPLLENTSVFGIWVFPLESMKHPALLLSVSYHAICPRNKAFEPFRTTLHIFYHPTASWSIFPHPASSFYHPRVTQSRKNLWHSAVIWESAPAIIRT